MCSCALLPLGVKLHMDYCVNVSSNMYFSDEFDWMKGCHVITYAIPIVKDLLEMFYSTYLGALCVRYWLVWRHSPQDLRSVVYFSQFSGGRHDDVIKWKHFPRYWPFVRGIHRSPVNFPHNGQWRGALMFSLICVWLNDWENNREAGDLRRYRTHYDVIVMIEPISIRVTSRALGPSAREMTSKDVDERMHWGRW